MFGVAGFGVAMILLRNPALILTAFPGTRRSTLNTKKLSIKLSANRGIEVYEQKFYDHRGVYRRSIALVL